MQPEDVFWKVLVAAKRVDTVSPSEWPTERLDQSSFGRIRLPPITDDEPGAEDVGHRVSVADATADHLAQNRPAARAGPSVARASSSRLNRVW